MSKRRYLLIGPLALVLGVALIAVGEQMGISADTNIASEIEAANHLTVLGYVLSGLGGAITIAALIALL